MSNALERIAEYKKVMRLTKFCPTIISKWARNGVMSMACGDSAYLKRRIVTMWPDRYDATNRELILRAVSYLKKLKPICNEGISMETATKKAKFIAGRESLIKDTVEDKMKLYHRLCDIGDFLLAKYNPCNFKDCACDGLDKTTCCLGCPDLKDGVGCTVKALQCKLYLCYDVREGHLHETLSKLQSVASMNGLIHYRKGAEYTEAYLRGK